MGSKTRPEQSRSEVEPFVILLVILATLLVMTICALLGSLLTLREEPRRPPIQHIPSTAVPTVAPTAAPVSQFVIYLPVIPAWITPQAVPQTPPGDIWEVTKIENLGYEWGGQRYDLATFKRLDGQDILQAHCTNPGWASPEIGALYSLNAEGVFIPLYEPNAMTIQRFLMIR